MKVPIRNVYYLLCYAWGHIPESNVVEVASLERLEKVDDLLGKVLAEGTNRLLARGIDRGYREVTEEIPGVRGKFEVGETIKRASLTRGKTVSTYAELSPDVLHNRILRSSLDTLRSIPTLAEAVREEVGLASRRMSGIESIRVTRQAFGRVQLDRNMWIYRFLLNVCRLLHESVLVDDRSGRTRFRDFRDDDATMWRLFEDFVAEFYRLELDRSEYHVGAQRKVDWYRAGADEPMHLARVPEMKPDLILSSPARRIILDTKYYRMPLARGRFGGRKLRSGHLYQLLAYLENRQRIRPDGPRHEGMLLYATVDEPVRVDVTLNGFRIQARSVNLDRRWQDVHDEMLETVRDPSVA